jgi:hypothetical protein
MIGPLPPPVGTEIGSEVHRDLSASPHAYAASPSDEYLDPPAWRYGHKPIVIGLFMPFPAAEHLMT